MSRSEMDPGLSALTFTYCFILPYLLGIFSMLAVMCNHCFTSLERLLELKSQRVPSERWLSTSSFDEPNPNLAVDWPSQGGIVFKNVQLRYRAGLPLVIDGLSLRVAPKEHLGIVGRTGA